MNYLQPWQIRFEKVYLKPFSDSFKTCVISNRVYKLILKKRSQNKWRVLQIQIANTDYDFGFKAVLTSPTHGTVLFIKKGKQDGKIKN